MHSQPSMSSPIPSQKHFVPMAPSCLVEFRRIKSPRLGRYGLSFAKCLREMSSDYYLLELSWYVRGMRSCKGYYLTYCLWHVLFVHILSRNGDPKCFYVCSRILDTWSSCGEGSD